MEDRLKVLVLEDSDTDYELVEEYLRTAPHAPPFQLTRAESVDIACQQLLVAKNDSQFDIVLVDLNLPDSKGEATFRAIQELAPDVAIAVLTGLDDWDLGLKLVKEGAQDFLAKDQLGPTYLLRSILHAIERKRIRLEMQRLYDSLQSAQLHLIQAEKIDALGKLSAGIVHEIKNPLAVLQGGIDYYGKRIAHEKDRTVHEMMQDAVQRATRIVAGLLDFSRDEKLELEQADLNELVGSVVELVGTDMNKAGIEVVDSLAPDLPSVALDTNKIKQVLINLLTNAMHASPKGSQIEITTFNGEAGLPFCEQDQRTLDLLQNGDRFVVIEVCDYGEGISEENVAKIFAPFFTTKAKGKGTGLGLSVCKTILDLHGGLLSINNVEPHGVRAQVILGADTAFRLQPASE